MSHKLDAGMGMDDLQNVEFLDGYEEIVKTFGRSSEDMSSPLYGVRTRKGRNTRRSKANYNQRQPTNISKLMKQYKIRKLKINVDKNEVRRILEDSQTTQSEKIESPKNVNTIIVTKQIKEEHVDPIITQKTATQEIKESTNSQCLPAKTSNKVQLTSTSVPFIKQEPISEKLQETSIVGEISNELDVAVQRNQDTKIANVRKTVKKMLNTSDNLRNALKSINCSRARNSVAKKRKISFDNFENTVDEQYLNISIPTETPVLPPTPPSIEFSMYHAVSNPIPSKILKDGSTQVPKITLIDVETQTSDNQLNYSNISHELLNSSVDTILTKCEALIRSMVSMEVKNKIINMDQNVSFGLKLVENSFSNAKKRNFICDKFTAVQMYNFLKEFLLAGKDVQKDDTKKTNTYTEKSMEKNLQKVISRGSQPKKKVNSTVSNLSKFPNMQFTTIKNISSTSCSNVIERKPIMKNNFKNMKKNNNFGQFNKLNKQNAYLMNEDDHTYTLPPTNYKIEYITKPQIIPEKSNNTVTFKQESNLLKTAFGSVMRDSEPKPNVKKKVAAKLKPVTNCIVRKKVNPSTQALVVAPGNLVKQQFPLSPEGATTTHNVKTVLSPTTSLQQYIEKASNVKMGPLPNFNTIKCNKNTINTSTQIVVTQPSINTFDVTNVNHTNQERHLMVCVNNQEINVTETPNSGNSIHWNRSGCIVLNDTLVKTSFAGSNFPVIHNPNT